MKIATLSPAQKLAHIVSILTVPPTFSFLSFVLLTGYFEEGTTLHRFAVAFVAVSFSSIIPILYVLYLRKERRVTGYDVPIREQRTNPYLMGVLNASLGFFLLLFMKASVFVWSLMWCYAINTLILYIINRRWKISAHAMGLTGPMVMLSVLFGWNVLFALPLVFVVGWARVILRVHSVAQVVSGTIAGAVLTTIQLYVIFDLARNFLKQLF